MIDSRFSFRIGSIINWAMLAKCSHAHDRTQKTRSRDTQNPKCKHWTSIAIFCFLFQKDVELNLFSVIICFPPSPFVALHDVQENALYTSNVLWKNVCSLSRIKNRENILCLNIELCKHMNLFALFVYTFTCVCASWAGIFLPSSAGIKESKTGETAS